VEHLERWRLYPNFTRPGETLIDAVFKHSILEAENV